MKILHRSYNMAAHWAVKNVKPWYFWTTATHCFCSKINWHRLSHRRMMTLKKGTFLSTRGLLPTLTSPKWMPPNLKNCWNCPRRAGLWWCSPQCREIPQRRKQKRSQDCGRAASSMPILTFRGLELIHQKLGITPTESCKLSLVQTVPFNVE